MNKKLLSLISHLWLFLVIEVLFVFVVLHEFPEISLFEKLWIVHLSYWILLIIAGFIRERVHVYRKKFLATYIPLVYHIAWHIYLWIATVEIIEEHQHHDISWMIIATIALWVIIFLWERLLHKKTHCDSCHAEAHKHCHEY